MIPPQLGPTYSEIGGVDYEALDSAKRRAVELAKQTDAFMIRQGGVPLTESRGHSAFVFSVGDAMLSFVVEGLGTKSIVAREYEQSSGEAHYDLIAYDAVAAIVNDLISVGAVPLVLNAYFATGSRRWFTEKRVRLLTQGWYSACRDTTATWGGGESPMLPGLVGDEEIELAGSGIGLIPQGEPVLGQHLAAGDEIVLLASSGLHANGASLARAAANRTSGGWMHPIEGGGTFGRAVLEPTIIYSPLVTDLLRQRIPLSYMSNITGHGLRKLMRADASFTYRIRALPPVPPVLRHICTTLGMSDHEAYGTFNMGAGFAIMCRPGVTKDVLETASRLGFRAIAAGFVECGERAVALDSVKVRFGSDESAAG